MSNMRTIFNRIHYNENWNNMYKIQEIQIAFAGTRAFPEGQIVKLNA